VKFNKKIFLKNNFFFDAGRFRHARGDDKLIIFLWGLMQGLLYFIFILTTLTLVFNSDDYWHVLMPASTSKSTLCRHAFQAIVGVMEYVANAAGPGYDCQSILFSYLFPVSIYTYFLFLFTDLCDHDSMQMVFVFSPEKVGKSGPKPDPVDGHCP
jgi:hypothetical protein